MIRKVVSFFIPLFLLAVAGTIIAFGRGYRIDFIEKEVKTTGILVATSDPDGAQIFIDGKFTGATNSNLTLEPGLYEVVIKKEGYQDWGKKVHIRAEGVIKTDAILFRSNPSLSPLLNTNAADPILSPDGIRIAYIATPSASPEENLGDLNLILNKPTLFIFDMTSRNNPFNKNPRPYEGVASDLLSSWESEDKTLKEIALSKFPEEFTSIASSSGKIIAFSADETKVLYEATEAATLERVIDPSLLGAGSVEEKRDLESGKIYVYDAKEDKNFGIDDLAMPKEEKRNISPARQLKTLVTPTPQFPKKLNFGWFGNSANLYVIEENKISLMEYSGENKVIVYSGPFVDSYVFPHPNGKEFVILTNLNPGGFPNPSLYTVNVR